MLKQFMSVAVLTMMTCGSAMAQEATRVATCNPGRVFESLDETKAIQKQMTEQRTRLKAEADKQKVEIDEIQRNLRDNLKPDSPQYAEKQRELRQKAANFNVFVQMAESDVAQAEKDHIRNLYRKIQEAVKEIAIEKKIDLVLTERKPQIPSELGQITPDQLRQLIIQNDVLFANEKVDITQDVIVRMNQKYAAGQSGN